MGVFDAITDALSGKRSAPARGGKVNTNAAFDGRALAEARNHEMCEKGMNPEDYGIDYKCTEGTTSGLDKAIQMHADKLHPPPALRKTVK